MAACLTPRAAACLLAAAVLGAVAPGAHALATPEPRIAIVLSAQGPPYVSAADALRQTLARRIPAAQVNTVEATATPAALAAALQGRSLVVTIGLAAAQRTLEVDRDTPLVAALIPKAGFESLPCTTLHGVRRCSAVYIDQPLARQLRLLELALPGRRRLGLVGGPQSGALAEGLREAASAMHFGVSIQRISDPGELYAALQSVLAQSDVLLAEPDPVALNAGTARSLLISAYRSQVPVLGLAESFVLAGATLGIYSTPEQQGQDAGDLAATALAAAPALLPAPQYPRRFLVKVNPHVARSLGLQIPEGAVLLERMEERQP